MTFKTTLSSITVAALLAASGPASAVPQSVIDRIVSDLSAQGFARIEIDIESDYIDVDAYGAGVEGDFYFSRSGVLLDADIDRHDSGEWHGGAYSGSDASYGRGGSYSRGHSASYDSYGSSSAGGSWSNDAWSHYDTWSGSDSWSGYDDDDDDDYDDD
jgi:hypothetical protein